MFSAPGPDEVLADLGDKVLTAFTASVAATRLDLSDFRRWRPQWFPLFTSRFLANFTHERLWAGMVERLDGQAGVELYDQEPRREIRVGSRYAIRVKRHLAGQQISTYPTPGALAFWASAETIPGLESISLALGYEWDREERVVGDPVLSYRDGVDKPVWQVRLVEGGGEGLAPITWQPIDPTMPEFDLSQFVEEGDSKSDDGQ